jgi:hypothetical protein
MAKRTLGFLFGLTIMACFVSTAAQAASGTYLVQNPGSIAIIGNEPGKNRDSNKLLISVTTDKIPDNAVVAKVTIKTGAVKNGPGTAINAITSYNLTPPGGSPSPVRWKNFPTGTRWTSLELPDCGVKGTWHLSMTGFNTSNKMSAVTAHAISSIEFEYTY